MQPEELAVAGCGPRPRRPLRPSGATAATTCWHISPTIAAVDDASETVGKAEVDAKSAAKNAKKAEAAHAKAEKELTELRDYKSQVPEKLIALKKVNVVLMKTL